LNQKKFVCFKVTSLTPFRLLDPLLQQRKPEKQEIFEKKREKEAERRRKEKDGNSFFSLLVVEVVPSPRADLTLEIFLLRFPNPPFYRYDSSFKKTYKQAATLLEEAEEEKIGQRRAKT